MKTKTIILVVAVILIAGAVYYLESLKVKPLDENVKSSVEEGAEVGIEENQAALKDGIYPLTPELTGIVGYINANEGIKISDFKGKVVLVDFWTYTCINCIRTLPFLTAWDEKYKDKGLVIIGVHTPEFEFEKDIENVKAAVEKYGIKYRVVQDNDYKTWRAFNNRFWPRKYLIDSDGYIRYDHIGEGAYAETELKIQELLNEIGENIEGINVTEEEERFSFQLTPELYAGYYLALSRGQDVGNIGGLKKEEVFDYVVPSNLEKDKIYLNGKWKSNSDNLELIGDNGGIILHFTAESVNIVADSINPQSIDILINGEFISRTQGGNDVIFFENKPFVSINKPQLYSIVNGAYESYVLELKVKKGFSFNSFTFG